MFKNRPLNKPKWLTNSRNLSNLHVIPTSSSSSTNINPLNQISSKLPAGHLKQQSNSSKHKSSLSTVPKPRRRRRSMAWQKKNFIQPEEAFYKSKKAFNSPILTDHKPSYYHTLTKTMKNRRTRKRRSVDVTGNHSYNPNNSKNVKSVAENSEAVADDCFEEVEVASYEAGHQEIPVSFRKSKVQYMNYKKKSFFKPKLYSIGQKRFIVNCLNAPKAASVDAVSEGEFEVEEVHVQAGEIGLEAKGVDVQVEKIELKVKEVDVQSKEVKEIDAKAKEIGSISEKVDTKSDKVKEVEPLEDTSGTQENFIELIDLDDDESNASVRAVEEMELSETVLRIYKTCIADNPDVCQGKSLIQSTLDAWKSHLIGLEYLIEVQNKSKDTALRYYCVLCDEDIAMEGFQAIDVINHINGYTHIIKYLEKHFPACGFRNSENSGYDNIVTLQKVCEEINRITGYYFMCITDNDQYLKSKEEMQKLILDAECSNEKSTNIDSAIIKTKFDSIVLEEVTAVINELLDNIAPKPKDSNIEANKKVSSKAQIVSKKEDRLKSTPKKKDSPKSTVTPKKSSAVSAYLKLMFATTKFSKSDKMKPKVTKVNSKIPAESEVTPTSVTTLSKVTSTTTKVTPAGKVTPVKKVADKLIEDKPDTEKENLVTKASSKIGPKLINQKPVFKSKEKAVIKPSVHSKHCPKRILSKENSRVTAKTSSNDEHASVPIYPLRPKTNVKNKYAQKSLDSVSVSKSVHEKKELKNDELKRYSNKVISSHKGPARKIGTAEKASPRGSKVSVKEHSKSPYRVVNIKVEKSPEIEIIKEVPRQISARSDSPSRERSSSPYKRIVRRLSKSPTRHMNKSPLSVSPTRHVIKSPLRVSPMRRRSRTPTRRRARTPVRMHSRSPIRRYSRSPDRRMSPIRRPIRSPLRKYSRSPLRRYSRSPIRRHSRSPLRRYSRSPVRRYSRSPIRRSRSPLRRRSRSPFRRQSRSPQRRHSRSPIKRRSRSPYRRHSRSPRHSKSPVKMHSRDLLARYKNTFRPVSPFGRSRNMQDRDSRDILGHFSRSKSPHPFDKHLGRYELAEFNKARRRSVSPSSISDKFIPFLNSLSSQDIDLDPVSDEDESNYFNTLDVLQNTDSKMSGPKMMFAEFLKKFSNVDVNPNDMTVNKFMQFMNAHSSEIQEMMASQSHAKSGKMSSNVAPSMQEQNSFLQQFLLQSLAGKLQAPVGSNVPFSNMPPTFVQPPFIPPHATPRFGPPPMMAGPPSQPLPNQPKIFPPNLNMPPPGQFPPMNQPPQNRQPHPPPILPPKPRVPPEIMFKDLKATVNKLFGPNRVQGENKPGFEPGPEKWDHSHPSGPNFNVSPGQKSFHSASTAAAGEEASYNRGPGQFFNSRNDVEQARSQNVPVPSSSAKVSFCDAPSGSAKGNLFPVVNRAQGTSQSARGSVSDVKVSLAQRLASVLVKVGMIDVPAPLLQEMLMKIGAFSSSPPQDITEAEIVSILKRLGYL